MRLNEHLILNSSTSPVILSEAKNDRDSSAFGLSPDFPLIIFHRKSGQSLWDRMTLLYLALVLSNFFQTSDLYSAPSEPQQESAVNFLFRDTFYVPPTLKLKYGVQEVGGFLLVRDVKRGGSSELAVVTGFEDPVLESRWLKHIRTIDGANTFLEKNTRKIFFERLPIKELPLITNDGTPAPRYWVGQRAFDSLEQAKAKIIEVKTAIETGGGNFERALELITEFFPEEPAPPAEEVRARYLAEEELAVKILDWLDVGETSYGPMTLIPGHVLGVARGEQVLWQAFGETSFRWTNLDRGGFNDQVGYVTNRLVFKGLRFLGEPTIDPYVEATTALQTDGANFPKHLDLIAGLEYRPFGRVNVLENFNFEGLYFLKFVRNYRFFVQYMERKNLTDEIGGSEDTDFWYGVDVFYEWGVDMDLPWVIHERDHWADWVRDFFWGEYFGSYRFERTDFSTRDTFESFILNSSVIFGVKVPLIKLPGNPVNDELMVMPYVRLEHVTNPNRLLPFQNRLMVVGGIRWMPFRSYQFEHNEWLFKTKLFAEYVGIGGVHHPGGANPDDVPHRDWRVGLNVSFKRY